MSEINTLTGDAASMPMAAAPAAIVPEITFADLGLAPELLRAVLDEALAPEGILAPQQAVSRDEKGQPRVLVVDRENKVQLRSLTTDRAIGDRWFVTSGLAAGERVVIEGTDKVKPGELVKPVSLEPTAKGG